MVDLEPWAFILRKEESHDEDIAKTRAASLSGKPRDLSPLYKAEDTSRSHPLVPEMSCGDTVPTPPSPRTNAIDLDAAASSKTKKGVLRL